MQWSSLFIGVLIGWLIEWLIDWVYWRRKAAAPSELQIQRTEEIVVEQDELATLHAELARLQSVEDELTARSEEADSLRAQLADANAERQNLSVRLERIAASAQKMPGQLGAALAALALGESVASVKRSEAFVPVEVEAEAEDDLTMIEGVGPKIAEVLNENGIRTFDQLGAAEVDDLRAILRDAGPGYQMADPSTWPRQARLAANRDWVKLQALKEQLVGGVRRPAEEPEAEDDLTMIEGVGPKIAEVLNENGIRTFGQLGDADVEDLRAMLRDAGPGYRMADPSSWPRQARLAADRDWVKLQALKEQLVGGVRRPAEEEPVRDDDLTMIEGIGPKIQELLRAEGIRTFAQLAETPVDRLEGIIQEGGPGMHLASPTTWPQQARLAADGVWEELHALQDELKAGRAEE
jgi:predicted flap endonuclease-1-like 5' DNA nuclease